MQQMMFVNRQGLLKVTGLHLKKQLVFHPSEILVQHCDVLKSSTDLHVTSGSNQIQASFQGDALRVLYDKPNFHPLRNITCKPLNKKCMRDAFCKNADSVSKGSRVPSS